MTVEEVISKFLKDKILTEEQGKIVLSAKYYPKTSKALKTQNFEKLLETYANTYPKSIKSGGRLVRRSANSLRVKLKSFTMKRKDIPYETILEAVNHYVKESKKMGYNYMIGSDYLISKFGSSELESLCDLIMEGELKPSGEDNYVTSLN